MNWKAYSWTAIRCCVSKSVLYTFLACAAVAAAVAVVLALIFGGVTVIEVVSAHVDVDLPPPPSWLLPTIGGLGLIGLFTFATIAICHDEIADCQVAVDLGRKPWYWIPWKRIADPLPEKEWIREECEHCGTVKSSREETEAEYRARLGLPELTT